MFVGVRAPETRFLSLDLKLAFFTSRPQLLRYLVSSPIHIIKTADDNANYSSTPATKNDVLPRRILRTTVNTTLDYGRNGGGCRVSNLVFAKGTRVSRCTYTNMHRITKNTIVGHCGILHPREKYQGHVMAVSFENKSGNQRKDLPHYLL